MRFDNCHPAPARLPIVPRQQQRTRHQPSFRMRPTPGPAVPRRTWSPPCPSSSEKTRAALLLPDERLLATCPLELTHARLTVDHRVRMSRTALRFPAHPPASPRFEVSSIPHRSSPGQRPHRGAHPARATARRSTAETSPKRRAQAPPRSDWFSADSSASSPRLPDTMAASCTVTLRRLQHCSFCTAARIAGARKARRQGAHSVDTFSVVDSAPYSPGQMWRTSLVRILLICASNSSGRDALPRERTEWVPSMFAHPDLPASSDEQRIRRAGMSHAKNADRRVPREAVLPCELGIRVEYHQAVTIHGSV